MTDKIEQSTYIVHEELGNAVEEWLKETGADQLPEDAQRLMVNTFKDGWSECLHRTMAPARDLCMMLLQIIQISKKAGADKEPYKVVLGGQSLEFIEELAHKVVGKPEGWQLDDVVEAVQVDVDNPPDDLPKEVLEAMKQAKKAATED